MTGSAEIIDGKALAAAIRKDLSVKVAACVRAPVLAGVMTGNNESSRIYVRNKQRAASEVGIDCRVFELPEGISQAELEKQVAALNRNPEIDGIIIQQPLPVQIDVLPLLELIVPEKDVDGFSPFNLGLLMSRSPRAVVAATPKGILRMLQSTGVELGGKHAVIIGRSNIVGKPLAQLLLNQDCTVTVTHSRTHNLRLLTAEADILVAACGCPEMVGADWVKAGALVIDFGINRLDGRLCGDVNFEDVLSKASFISPVPGGVGPMTVAMLLENTYEAFVRRQGE